MRFYESWFVTCAQSHEIQSVCVSYLVSYQFTKLRNCTNIVFIAI